MKKISLLFITLVAFTFAKIDVFAEIIPIDEVVNKISTGDLKTYFDSFNEELSVTNDTTNKKIVITTTTGGFFEVGYTDEYIEYVNNDDDVTAEDFDKDMFSYLGLGAITDAILDLAGHGDKTIKDSYPYNDYDTYGLLLNSEEMDFTATGGGKGDFVRRYKISLDTNKIDKLIEDYGESANSNTYANLTASVTADSITSTSVYIEPTVIDYTHTGSESDVPLCQIFKSDREDGEFALTSNAAINCTGGLSLLVDDLTPNTSYYFKARVVGSENFGPSIKVTTLSNGDETIDNQTNNENNAGADKNDTDQKNDTSNEEKKNPKTGINDYYISLTVVIILGGITYLFIRNKNYIRQI